MSLSAICDEVVSELNTQFGGTFTAARSYNPQFDVPDFDTIRATVVQKDKKTEMLTRGGGYRQDDFLIDVSLQKRLESEDPLELDPLEDLVEEIETFFAFRALNNVDGVCIKTDYQAVFDPAHIRETRIFTGVVTLTFRTSQGTGSGGGGLPVTSNGKIVYATYQMTSADQIIIADTTAGTFAVHLPVSPGAWRGPIIVRVVGPNVATVDTSDGKLIEGDPSVILDPMGWQSLEFIYDGTQWRRI